MGAKRTWYLVNGSTCGILAAIRAAVVSSGRTAVICARNCHKSVYHAIELNRLMAHWLVPPVDPAFGIYGSITPAMVADALRACPDAAAVILTSPTYEGVLSDLAAIAALCHAANVPLIVDEAHGAHYLPLAAAHGWQGGAIAAGADVIIQSPHKTLPSLTQTALLHWNSSFIPPQELERQLDVFETSSPSYPLMASLDAAPACWPNTAMPGLPPGVPACSGSAALCAHCAACACFAMGWMMFLPTPAFLPTIPARSSSTVLLPG